MRTKVNLPTWIATETKLRPKYTWCRRISVNYFHRNRLRRMILRSIPSGRNGNPLMHQRSIYRKHVWKLRVIYIQLLHYSQHQQPNETKRKKKIEKKTEVSILCCMHADYLVWFDLKTDLFRIRNFPVCLSVCVSVLHACLTEIHWRPRSMMIVGCVVEQNCRLVLLFRFCWRFCVISTAISFSNLSFGAICWRCCEARYVYGSHTLTFDAVYLGFAIGTFRRGGHFKSVHDQYSMRNDWSRAVPSRLATVMHDGRRVGVFCPNDFQFSFVLCFITSSILLRVNKFVWNGAKSVHSRLDHWLDHRFFVLWICVSLAERAMPLSKMSKSWIACIACLKYSVYACYWAVVWVGCIDLVCSAFPSILVDSICHTNGMSPLLSPSPSPCLPLAPFLSLHLSLVFWFIFEECVHFIAVIAPINWHK